MVRNAQQGSAAGPRGRWPLAAALLACLLIVLASAADAVAALPSVAAIPSTTQRAAAGPAGVATPIREAAGHAVAALSAEDRPAAPGPGATSIAGHPAQLTAGEATQAVRTATQLPSAAAAGAGGLTAVAKAVPAVEHTDAAGRPAVGNAVAAVEHVDAGGLPAVAKAVPAIEHTATRAGQLVKDLAAAAESSGNEPRQLLGSTAQTAGGLVPAASRRSRLVGSRVPRATSTLKRAARPAAGAITGPPSRHSAGAGGGGLRLGTVARASAPVRPGVASLAAPRAELAAPTAGRRPTLVRSPLATAHAARGRPGQSMNGLGPVDPRVLASVSRFGPLLTPGAPLTAGAAHRRGALGAVARLPGPAGTGPVPMTSGGPGSAAGGYGVAFSIFLALAGFLLIAPVGAMSRLRLCAEPWRTAPYLLIPERPG